jgi:hypothetical protein
MKQLIIVALALAGAAHAGTVEISDDINARLARTKSRVAAEAAERGAALGNGAALIGVPGASGGGCNIAIGNVFEDKKPGAISTSARRETTVIVTGDVIQVGNNCR